MCDLNNVPELLQGDGDFDAVGRLRGIERDIKFLRHGRCGYLRGVKNQY